jgi:hypothetical protein
VIEYLSGFIFLTTLAYSMMNKQRTYETRKHEGMKGGSELQIKHLGGHTTNECAS